MTPSTPIRNGGGAYTWCLAVNFGTKLLISIDIQSCQFLIVDIRRERQR